MSEGELQRAMLAHVVQHSGGATTRLVTDPAVIAMSMAHSPPALQIRSHADCCRSTSPTTEAVDGAPVVALVSCDAALGCGVVISAAGTDDASASLQMSGQPAPWPVALAQRLWSPAFRRRSASLAMLPATATVSDPLSQSHGVRIPAVLIETGACVAAEALPATAGEMPPRDAPLHVTLWVPGAPARLVVRPRARARQAARTLGGSCAALATAQPGRWQAAMRLDVMAAAQPAVEGASHGGLEHAIALSLIAGQRRTHTHASKARARCSPRSACALTRCCRRWQVAPGLGLTFAHGSVSWRADAGVADNSTTAAGPPPLAVRTFDWRAHWRPTTALAMHGGDAFQAVRAAPAAQVLMTRCWPDVGCFGLRQTLRVPTHFSVQLAAQDETGRAMRQRVNVKVGGSRRLCVLPRALRPHAEPVARSMAWRC